jgi:hypothetical protein
MHDFSGLHFLFYQKRSFIVLRVKILIATCRALILKQEPSNKRHIAYRSYSTACVLSDSDLIPHWPTNNKFLELCSAGDKVIVILASQLRKIYVDFSSCNPTSVTLYELIEYLKFHDLDSKTLFERRKKGNLQFQGLLSILTLDDVQLALNKAKNSSLFGAPLIIDGISYDGQAATSLSLEYKSSASFKDCPNPAWKFCAALTIELAVATAKKLVQADIKLCFTSCLYSPDLVLRAFLRRNQIHTINFDMDVYDRKYVRVMSSRGHDWLHRSELNALGIAPADAKTVYNFCAEYIDKHILGRSAMNYSPMCTSIESIVRLREWIISNPIVYYSSSPDEIISLQQQAIDAGLNNSFIDGMATEEDGIHHALESANILNRRLVIRLHPRLGKEARSTAVSDRRNSLVGFCDDLAKNNENVIVVYPEDKVNSYELAFNAFLSLSLRSTIILDLRMLGLHAYLTGSVNGLVNSVPIRAKKLPSLSVLSSAQDNLDLCLASDMIEFYNYHRAGKLNLFKGNAKLLVAMAIANHSSHLLLNCTGSSPADMVANTRMLNLHRGKINDIRTRIKAFA